MRLSLYLLQVGKTILVGTWEENLKEGNHLAGYHRQEMQGAAITFMVTFKFYIFLVDNVFFIDL